MRILYFVLLLFALISCESKTDEVKPFVQGPRGVMVGDTVRIWVDIDEHRSFHVEEETIASLLEKDQKLWVIGKKLGETKILVTDDRTDDVIGIVPVCVTNQYICLSFVGDGDTPEELRSLGKAEFLLVANESRDCVVIRWNNSDFKYAPPILTGSYSISEDAPVISFDLTGVMPDFKESIKIVSGDYEILNHMSDILKYKDFSSYPEAIMIGAETSPFHIHLSLYNLKLDDYEMLMR